MPRQPFQRRLNELCFFYAIGTAKGPIRKVAKKFFCSPDKVVYWRRKLSDPTFHPEKRGGARNRKFQGRRENKLHLLIWSYCKQNPCAQLKDYVLFAKCHGYKINRMYLSRLFRQWHWSFKCPEFKQINKFSASNIRCYVNFLLEIRQIPWSKLKFLDEAHIAAKDLRAPKGLGPKGKKVFRITATPLDVRYSLTLLTTLSDPVPIVVDLREESNTQWDFLDFIVYCIGNNHLSPGDTLVCDNATVHVGDETTDTIFDLLAACQVKLLFLPTYASELNPCELVFGLVKKKLRSSPQCGVIWKDLLAALTTVSSAHVVSFYSHCLL